jgi:hypothetical protein
VIPSSFARQADRRTLIAFVDIGGISAILPYPTIIAASILMAFRHWFSIRSIASEWLVTGRGFTVLPNGNIFGFDTDQLDQNGNVIFEYGILRPTERWRTLITTPITVLLRQSLSAAADQWPGACP